MELVSHRLAARYGINRKTVMKWRHRGTTAIGIFRFDIGKTWTERGRRCAVLGPSRGWDQIVIHAIPSPS